MKRFKKILIAIVLLILIIIVIGYLYINHVSTKGITEYTGEIKLKNLKEKVIVRRDAYAIPHIIAQNEEDLYRATGYVIAQDRLWQMDLLRRVTMGRLSEIFGKDLIKVDQLMRALRIPDKSKLIVEKTDKEIILALEAFADGVNQYIETHKDKLPPEFTILGYEPEKWEVEHSINLIGYMAWDLTMSWSSEIILHKVMQQVDFVKFKQLIPDLNKQNTSIFAQSLYEDSEFEIIAELTKTNRKLSELGLDIFSGSNNWAVSGKKSTTGMPILANDMHLGLFAPGIWYQMHQYVENKVNVTGLLLPGAPFIIDGHNENIAWGMTNIMIDDMDFYLETVNPNDSNQYLLNGEWKDMQVRNETICTSDGDTLTDILRFTHRGPVISGLKNIKDKVISMRWIGNEFSNELSSIYRINRAKNWDEFKEALKTFTALGQNVIYADIQGNIGLWSACNIPLRKGDPWLVYRGDTTEFDWTGYVSFDSLPHEFNPQKGYLGSANCKTIGPDYPHYISMWFDQPYRMDRINEMLEEKEKLSVEDFNKIQGDHKSKLVERLFSDIVENISDIEGLTEKQKQAVELFKKWDGVLTVESQATPIFEYFYICFVNNIISDELGPDLYKEFISNKILVRNVVNNLWTNPGSEWYDNISTKEKQENFKDIVQKSFKDALDSLKSKMGANPKNWQWGNIHTVTLKHPLGKVAALDFFFNLNRGPYPVGGSSHTVCPYTYMYDNLFEVTAGASHRHIYSIADWDKSLTVIPTGISGIPSSPYYCDQTEMYLRNELHNDYFDIRTVEKNTNFRMTLLPGE